jgi:hypothetical protein
VSATQIPERSIFPLTRGAGAVRFGLPSAVRGMPAERRFSHCAGVIAENVHSAAVMVRTLTTRNYSLG